MNNGNMWYNGAYTMTSFVSGNEKVFTKNPLYWDTECTRFDTVTHKMVESNEVAYMLFENGENDYVTLGRHRLPPLRMIQIISTMIILSRHFRENVQTRFIGISMK